MYQSVWCVQTAEIALFTISFLLKSCNLTDFTNLMMTVVPGDPFLEDFPSKFGQISKLAVSLRWKTDTAGLAKSEVSKPMSHCQL